MKSGIGCHALFFARMALLWILLLLCGGLQFSRAQNFPPTFNPVVESINILELTMENSDLLIYDVNATDPEGDPVTYVIPVNTVNSHLFRIENYTGKIYTQSGVILDRESLTPDNDPLDLFIEARDEHHDDFAQFQLIIVLQDINDNHPIFAPNTPTEITVPEDTELGQIVDIDATDVDSSQNGFVVFSLNDNSGHFEINRESGRLRLIRELEFDGDATIIYSLPIVAEDLGENPNSGFITITIRVSDVDDMDPVFEPATYLSSIPENSTFGDLVTTVSARDGDIGVDDEVFYTLQDRGNEDINGSLIFSINQTTGEVFVNVSNLDRETNSSYTLTVEATQVNDHSRVTFANIYITVLDINDNIPIFDPRVYEEMVLENITLETELLTVSVSDKDEGSNAEFQLDLENLLNQSSLLPFIISPSGVITLSVPLDFEEIEYYLFNVRALEDDGGNSTGLVRVNVENVNDANPQFQPLFYSANISENVADGAFVQLIKAYDADKPPFNEITYHIINGSDDFYINSTGAGGAVFTAVELDFEEITSYNISIDAIDSGNRSADTIAVLVVDVVNMNDNPPEFENDSLTVSLDEESPLDTRVVSLIVNDKDGINFTNHSFSITAGNDLGVFAFDSELENTIVTVEENLDYEQRPNLREQTLTIVVNDTVYTDEITLTINLVDINDNTPVFLNSSYQFAIEEGADVLSVVGSVKAEDDDSGSLGTVLYSISSNEKFIVDYETGEISTNASLNREEQELYTIIITATDQDEDITARNSQSVEVNITVLDINDNSPEFTIREYELDVVENTDVISLSVSAIDIDSGTNSMITYSIITGNTDNTFTIDQVNGVVTRNPDVALDREHLSFYKLTILAEDGGTPSYNDTASINITIMDENDNRPVFDPVSINATIDEDVEDEFVLTISATDMDTSPNAAITYSLTVTGPPQPYPGSADPTPPSGTFIIDSETGDITTQGEFDRENFEGPYFLEVIANDNGVGVSLSGSAEVLIYINDINDNSPTFLQNTYYAEVMEDVDPGHSVVTVTAIDRDFGSNSDITYEITSAIDENDVVDQLLLSNHFTLNSDTGVVRTGAALDYEFVTDYTITISATDGETTSMAVLTVTVKDVNDNTPQFSSSLYNLFVSEDTFINTRFSLLEVTDSDSGENRRLSFSADIDGPLEVDPETGEVIVIQTLDYESITNYTFTVNVSDNGETPNTNSTEVTVIVSDVNDNIPVFNQSVYSTTIAETDTTYDILSVAATDEDSEENGKVSYTLISDTNDVFFLNNETGILSVVGDIDFEIFNTVPGASELVLKLRVIASDSGQPPLSSNATIFITVTDINDNSPVFLGVPYITSVRENSPAGVEIITVRASDSDSNENNVVRYSLNDTTNFSINEVTGVIRTGTTATVEPNSSFYDFEDGTASYELTVYATDNGVNERETEAIVTVHILDVNDNSPMVSVAGQNVIVSEGSMAGYEIGTTITVSDADDGDNGEVDYTLSNDGGMFTVSSTGIVSLTSQLDREKIAEYNITVTVTDRGEPRMSATSYFIVSVEDENDNDPMFLQDLYIAIMAEELDAGYIVDHVFANDFDSHDTSGGMLNFRIINSEANSLFRLQPTYSNVDEQWVVAVETTTDDFDYETKPNSYLVEIEARDGGGRTGTTNLTIYLYNIPDSSPYFSRASYTFSIPSNLIGVVGNVIATDPEGETVTYSLSSTTSTNFLQLNAETGVLTTTSAISSSQDLTVSVSAGNRDPVSVSVRVNVEMVNDNSPSFTQTNYTVTVSEGVVSVVLPLTATGTGTITYSIENGADSNFVLHPSTGILSVIGPLDRETIPYYTITISAEDSDSNIGYTQVFVVVGDTNDVTPSFPYKTYSYFVPENSYLTSNPTSNELSPSITATDSDEGNNGQIEYSLGHSTPENHPFIVDPSSGLVTLTDHLDREMTSFYQLTLLAVDGGSTRNTGSIELRITVTDISDEPPQLILSSSSTSIPENSPEGVFVMSIEATDADLNPLLTYSITGGDPLGQFNIDRECGVITTSDVSLDRERTSQYSLTVTVTDDMGLSDEAVVTVMVEDENDNTPSFSLATYSSTIDEFNVIDVLVSEVVATDHDYGSNGVVQYDIAGGNSDSIFYIDSITGQIFAYARMLDYETETVHTLVVRAEDNATSDSQKRFSTTEVIIQLRDVNDNRPTFTETQYSTTVTENISPGTTVATISASDGDTGTNGDITYSLGAPSRLFAINGSSGVVTVIGSVDYETGREHELSVEAKDDGNPQQSNVVQLLVQVINIDDEDPRFPISLYTVSVTEDVPSSTTVLRISATDPDGSDSIRYDLIQSSSRSSSSVFSINPVSGEISTVGPLDRETEDLVNLQVTATDSAGHNGTATVQISVLDVNDNIPQFTTDSYTASLRENSPPGITVIPMFGVRVEAIDADEPGPNSRVSYGLEGGDSDKFSIDRDSGVVTIATGAVLDHEMTPTLQFTITAEDLGNPDTTADVPMTVYLEDVNDNIPIFIPPSGYAVVVAEDTTEGTDLITVEATDPDLMTGEYISFQIDTAVPLNTISYFSINSSSGTLILEEDLDREDIPHITVTISAHDNGSPNLAVSTSVQISVGDVNDNPPIFSQDTYIVVVPEDHTLGASILTVVAEDLDLGSNGRVEYSVINNTDIISINSHTGEVSIRESLDYETSPTTHNVTVKACDNGVEILCSTTDVIVYVSDTNDEQPTFDFPYYRTDICHSQMMEEVFLQIVAIDRDSGDNSILTYTIHDTNGIFELNSRNGQISLQRALQLEEVGSEFTATVTARDGGDPSLSGTTQIIVRILNCSLDAFRFVRPFYDVEVEEEQSTIATLSIDGLETIPTTPFFLQFEQELSNYLFRIFINTLLIEEKLNREDRQFYTLPIVATSTGQVDTAYATIGVSVLDINDHSPLLQLPALSFTVEENEVEPVYITTALATDNDIGSNAEIEFSLDPPVNDYFSINESTGVLTTITELDRENTSQHQLTILASDGTFFSTMATISIHVADKNDNTPEFIALPYTVTVLEGVPAGTSVLTLEATDPDLKENGTLTFSVVGGDTDLFSLNSETGVIRTTAVLDHEDTSIPIPYSLIVSVTDGGSPSLIRTEEIMISVEDFNDNTPQFENPVTSIIISETTSPGYTITDFNVTDLDSGEFGEEGVIFSIVAGDRELFSINNLTGILTTIGTLDREDGNECYILTIQATDSSGGVNSLSSVSDIEVCLRDENDNCPVFTVPTFNGEIPENVVVNQQLQLRVQATDSDSDKSTNGAIRYQLLRDGGVFDINDITGFLSLTSSLDTETTPRYELLVEACDLGEDRCCTNTTIAIDVLDYNDNRPIITNVELDSCISVSETSNSYSCQGRVQNEGSVIYVVNATDADSGLNGAVYYTFLQTTSPFTISSSGVITITGPLDYEEVERHQLYINAVDRGEPQQMSETNILCIEVQDINDRAPLFPVDQYVVQQDEEIVPDTAILQVVATDTDAGDNAAVFYSITEGNTSIFQIDENGQLFLLEELDSETMDDISITITANNSLSICPLSSTVDVLVIVNDVNDNSPILSQDMYNTTVFENITIGQTILTVSATDADKNAPNNKLQYRLILGAGSNPFHLNDSGVLSIQNALNAEGLSGLQYMFEVEVRDSAESFRSDRANVVISVEDVNDEPPTFQLDTFSYTVSEGDSSPSTLQSLTYTDNDILLENRISRFSITSITATLTQTNDMIAIHGAPPFIVSGNNTLDLQQSLDRETVSSYTISLLVENTAPCQRVGALCSSSVDVQVSVTDINDNTPQFTTNKYFGEVSVTASIGTSVVRVEATDADTGNFQQIRYSLMDSLNGRFRIDEEAGVLLTRGDFENLDGKRLTLTVLATDNPGSSPSLTATSTVEIVVLNDFQRISVLFSCGIENVLQSEDDIIRLIANISGLHIQVENYADHSDDISSNFIFHATDPETNAIVDFDEFFTRLTEAGQGDQEAQLITSLSDVCPVEKITAFANIEDYAYPDALDTQTIVIFTLCVILLAGAFTTLILSIRQRWAALHDTRTKLLADVFYGSPGSASLVENVHQENIQLEEMAAKGDQQNPMFVQPYDNWDGFDASGPGSTGEMSSMNRDNPLYESQEIRMEMFADESDDEGDEADDAQLLAAALQEDEEQDDNSVTAI